MKTKILCLFTLLNLLTMQLSEASINSVNELHRSLWDDDSNNKILNNNNFYELNLVSSKKFQALLIDIISSEPQYDLMKEMLESDLMTAQIENFYESYFQRYSQAPTDFTAIRYANTFVEHLQRIFGIKYDAKVVQRVNFLILNVLLPKRRNNMCQMYLYSVQ